MNAPEHPSTRASREDQPTKARRPLRIAAAWCGAAAVAFLLMAAFEGGGLPPWPTVYSLRVGSWCGFAAGVLFWLDMTRVRGANPFGATPREPSFRVNRRRADATRGGAGSRDAEARGIDPDDPDSHEPVDHERCV